MKNTKINLIVAAAGFAAVNSVTSVQAQYSLPDRYDVPSHSTSTRSYLDPPTRKVYVGFDIGPAFQQGITITDTIGDSDQVSFGTGVRMDFQLGYNFTPHWAAELESGLIIVPVNNSVFLGTDFMDVTFVEFPVMLNVIYTQPLGDHASAYVGGGVGGAFSDYSNEFGESTESDATFAYQGLAGLKYSFNEKWELGLTYKFLGTTEHNVGSGLDSNFNPTTFQSSGTLTHAVVLALTCRF